MHHAGKTARRGTEDPGNRRLIGHVGADEGETVLAGQLIGVGQIATHHRRTIIEQSPRGGQTDARSRTGDHHCHTVEAGHPQRAPRTSRPGRAPVSTPSRRVTTPLTIVAVYPEAPWTRRCPPAGRS